MPHDCQYVPHVGPLIEIKSWNDIPDFANECEEASFWGSHTFSARMMRRMARNRRLLREIERELPPPVRRGRRNIFSYRDRKPRGRRKRRSNS